MLESALGTTDVATERGRRRREQIVDEATLLFQRQGFAATSIDQIGEASGVTGPAIYRHFESKDEILLAVLDRIWDLLRDALERAEPLDAASALDVLMEAHLTLVLDHRPEALVLVRELRHVPEEYRRAAERNDVRYMDAWASVIAGLRQDLSMPQARAAARAVTGLIGSAAAEPRARRLDRDGYRVLLSHMARSALGLSARISSE